MVVFKFKNAAYRKASLKDLARIVASYLWQWIYRTGITKQQVIDWFAKFDPRQYLKERQSGLIPDEIKLAVARMLATSGIEYGDFVQQLSTELENPPPGFRWKTDRFGSEILVKVSGQSEEKPLVRGKKFAGTVFIGVWWSTSLPRGKSNQALQRYLRKHNGAVFWKVKDAGKMQYGGFLMTPIASAKGVAVEVKQLCEAMSHEDEGEYSLSAVRLDGPAEHRKVEKSDQIALPGINSIKFNDRYTLIDLLNGRIAEFKHSEPYVRLIDQLRAARDAA